MIRYIVIFAIVAVGFTSAYQHYQSEIPNGDKVPDPSSGSIWKGVGHENAQGGGDRNPFGKDFADNNHKWTASLCNKDSDSDGKTNGEELGDKSCSWTKGATPSKTSDLSHPGICEPINSVACQGVNSDVDVNSAKPFSCAATSKSGVQSSTYRFPSSEIPAKETNYFCKYFPIQLSGGSAQHIIAYEPVIDNEEVMHHTLVYGCKGDVTASDAVADCSDGMTECNELVMVWAVGINGFCFPDHFGTLIGEGGYTGLWMEHHWNNPRKMSGLRDSSGIKVYHTADIRVNEARYIIWGPQFFSLEPGKKEETASGLCPARRTKGMKQDTMKITQIIPHMHYLGRKMVIKHKGEVILTETSYSYDTPKIYDLDTPLEFARGDEINVECTFDTTGASETTYYGPATADEMCFMVAQVYPFDDSIPTFCGISGAHRVVASVGALMMMAAAAGWAMF